MRKYAFLREPLQSASHGRVVKIMLCTVEGGVFLFTYPSLDAVQCSSDDFYDSLDALYDAWNELIDEHGWIDTVDPLPNCQQDALIPLRVKGRESGKPEWGEFETLQGGKWIPYPPRSQHALEGADMRLLFVMDRKDHSGCTHTFSRNSARSIIIRDGRVAMVYSTKYGYYKFPGGGIEAGESPVDAMIRETREETGLRVLPETVKAYGMVHRVQKSDRDDNECFIQDNYYYLCDAEDDPADQELDAYEAQESCRLVFTDAETAIRKNSSVQGAPYNRMMFEREARILALLQAEGRLK